MSSPTATPPRTPGLLQWVGAVIAITYGFAKLNGSQFTVLDSELARPMGDVQGFWLTWHWLGWSTAYGGLIAATQILGGVLLVLPRFSLAGALLLLPVVVNILFIDFIVFIVFVVFVLFFLVVFVLVLVIFFEVFIVLVLVVVVLFVFVLLVIIVVVSGARIEQQTERFGQPRGGFAVCRRSVIRNRRAQRFHDGSHDCRLLRVLSERTTISSVRTVMSQCPRRTIGEFAGAR